MANKPTTTDGIAPAVVIADVWSRTEPKYRRRATVLLIINVLLFAGMASVAYWLREGVASAPMSPDYWDKLVATFHPMPDTQHTPTGLSLGPISVEQVPMMIPVLGLVLAALISIPVLTAILYRFPCSVPFLLVVAFVAVMPWLAIALLGSCLLASVRPFRMRSRFASALMGLVPVIIYFFMASRQIERTVDVLANPADRVKIIAPLTLAVVASAVVMGIVLLTAHIVRYRPGAISPLLAILFLTPVALFEFKVGRDELHYRLLERGFGPSSEYFVQQEFDRIYEQTVQQLWASRQGEGLSYEQTRGQVLTQESGALDADVASVLAEYRKKAAAAADEFVKYFPDSRYACHALYVKARAMDLRADMASFRRDQVLEFYDDFPSDASRHEWERIEANGPGSPMAAAALLRLAQLDAREGAIDRAIGRLERLEQLPGASAPDAEGGWASAGPGSSTARRPAYAGLAIPRAKLSSDGSRLRGLFENNRDPALKDEPLRQFLALDAHDPQYTRRVERLRERFPESRLDDQLELAIAMAAPDAASKTELLERCATRPSSGDALADAVYQLGIAYAEEKRFAEARGAFERVLREHAESIWRGPAENQLRRIETVTAGAEP
ncbi:MAG: tetratricopeptide repeat protein [Phycisphaerales bacterium]|nr:tetratricopeptide repeat protein [Phycisphaerales bacterium]